MAKLEEFYLYIPSKQKCDNCIQMGRKRLLSFLTVVADLVMASHIKVLLNDSTLTHVGLFINYKQVTKYLNILTILLH